MNEVCLWLGFSSTNIVQIVSYVVVVELHASFVFGEDENATGDCLLTPALYKSGLDITHVTNTFYIWQTTNANSGSTS